MTPLLAYSCLYRWNEMLTGHSISLSAGPGIRKYAIPNSDASGAVALRSPRGQRSMNRRLQDLSRFHRLAGEEPLDHITSQLSQGSQLTGSVDTFRHHLEA